MSQETAYSFFDQLLIEELRHSLEIIDESDDFTIHEAIHQLRKSMKRIRGWLRAVRPAGNAKKYNQELSGIGKEISALRDSTSAIECAERLKTKFGDHLNPEIFKSLEDSLISQREDLASHIRPKLMRVRARLAALLHSYDPFYIDSYTDLLRGITRTYEVARENLGVCIEKFDPDVFHEWRKRTKDLQHQCLMFPDEISFFHDLHSTFDKLTDALGNDQDLYLIEDAMKQWKTGDEARELIYALTRSDHERLQAEALKMGKSVYEETPNSFIKKLALHLNE